MKDSPVDMSTDSAWEQWGHRDPYYGVITDPKFRRSVITTASKREFFESGTSHAHHVLGAIRKHIDADFVPRRILDFGCGVGRLLVPFATMAEEVVGLDVAPSMLDEARRNCAEGRLHNVRLLLSNDELSALTGNFDLIHSSIVFQHIPVERGRAIFSRLLKHLRPSGVCAIHMTYSKTSFIRTRGVAPVELRSKRGAASAGNSGGDPEIQMNPYNMNEVFFLMQCQGVQKCHVEFSDHGGELGVFLFFSLTGAPTADQLNRSEL